MEEDRTRFLFGAEEPFHVHPKLPGGLLIAVHGEVEDNVVDGAEDPAADAAVRLISLRPEGIRGRRRKCGAIDVRLEAEFAAHLFEERSPLGVVGDFHHQLDRNVRLHGDGGEGVDHGRREGSCRASGSGGNSAVAGGRHASIWNGGRGANHGEERRRRMRCCSWKVHGK